ncbi:MAG: Mur ligase family protein [Candidatus Hydrogenedentota bacterium]
MEIKYHFSGIAGSGMSALAYLLYKWGYIISGSDRFVDQGIIPETIEWIHSCGDRVKLYPQDGSGIDEKVDFLVISSAVEFTNPEIQKAVSLNIPVVKRAVLLSNLFNTGKGIAVGGTSGKSTVTSLIYHLLKEKSNPTFVCGAEFRESASLGNVKVGDRDFFIIETDESDRGIVLFKPDISVITNITLDHHPIEELKRLFQKFIDNTYSCVVFNSDCKLSNDLNTHRKEVITFGVKKGMLIPKDLNLFHEYSVFYLDKIKFVVPMPGLYNVYNVLSAIAVARAKGVSLRDCKELVCTYPGIKRRFDILYKGPRFYVVDDFAHNPCKIRSVIESAKNIKKNLIVIYQPHGYNPTKLVKNDLIDVFSTCLCNKDRLYLLPIFYAGGTSDKSISSEDIVKEVKNVKAEALTREALLKILPEILQDIKEALILILGARDPTLPSFAQSIASICSSSPLSAGLQNDKFIL